MGVSTDPYTMGKSQSRLRFKSLFEHILILDLNYKDSIEKTVIQFHIWFEIFGDSIFKNLSHDKSAACLPTQNGMHESVKHFWFGCELMPKLRKWMIGTVYS